MNDVVIVSAVRTALGRVGGSIKTVQPEEIASIVITAAVERAGIEPASVDEVIIGQTKQSADAANLARVAALKAGFPVEVPAYTVMRQCGSGLQAIHNAVQVIRAEEAEIVVAGGVESMSLAPYYLRGARFGFTSGNTVVVDSNTESQPRSQPYEVYGDLTMGLTAENLAEKYQISREEQDAFARQSQERAADAIESGRFKDEIVPVEVPQRKGPPAVFDTDEHPRLSSLEQLAKLRPVFKEGGSVTAGNSSGRNDGGACLVLMSADAAKKKGLTPLATVRGQATAAVDPRIMGIGPGAGLAQGARARRPQPLGHRPHRGQRGLCGAGPGSRQGAGPGPGDRQRQRRRHRARASSRLLRRPHHDDAALRDAPARHALRARRHLHRRRPGHGHRRRDGPLSRAGGRHALAARQHSEEGETAMTGIVKDPYSGLELIELSHVWGHGVPSEPGQLDVRMQRAVKHAQHGVLAWRVITSLHTGTHMNAPIHMVQRGDDLAAVSPDRLFGNAAVLDLPKKSWEVITAADLEAATPGRAGRRHRRHRHRLAPQVLRRPRVLRRGARPDQRRRRVAHHEESEVRGRRHAVHRRPARDLDGPASRRPADEAARARVRRRRPAATPRPTSPTGSPPTRPSRPRASRRSSRSAATWTS